MATLPFPLYADRMNTVWMGYNEYLIRYDPISRTFTKFKYPVQRTLYDYDFLNCIYEDVDRLWLGSVQGLFSLNIKNNHWTYYGHQQQDTGSLSNDFVLSLCNDVQKPEAYLWIGTKGGGLNLLNKRTGQFTRYLTKDGLANDVVYGILPDEKGNLWLSTNKGLSRFNTATKRFSNFDVSDGLQSNEFNRYAYCKTNEGILIFGGVNGLNYFNPDDIKTLSPPEVVLTDFRLFNKSVDFKKPGSLIRKNISFVSEVVLEYKQNVLTFQFAALDYRKSGGARYRYRMEGFDEDWIYSATGREATYTNLDPGTYRFIVQGSFSEDVWGKEHTSLRVTIIPPGGVPGGFMA